MTRTASTMPPLGGPAPAFRLFEPASGAWVALDDFADSPALVVVFMSNHCPFVRHVRHELAALAREYAARGLAVVGINANDVEAYPDDAPACMVTEVERVGYPFAYLFDESQEVAKAYGAACTPDFFLYDAERRLAYRGQFDASRPGLDLPVTGEDLRAAVESVLAGEPAPEPQRPSVGCNIKWKPGNAPDYFG
jgi:thiol-disulfide isomerase/thioredoxin